MKKLKVIQIIDSLAVGGAEMMAVNIANALLKVEVESHLCVTRAEGNLKLKLHENVNYVFLKKRFSVDVLAIFKLKKYIKQHNIDIVHAHSSSYFIASIIKILYPKIKLIWHDHYGNSELLNKRKKQPLKFFSKKFTAIISVNNKLKEWATINLNTKNTLYLPNFASLKGNVKKTNLKGVTGKRIVCVAGFRAQKDHLNLLKAFKIIIKNHKDWTLHLVGNSNNNNYFKSITSYVLDNHLSKKVFIYHNATDINYILSQASIGVLSSASEGLPVALLEYGLAKLPVVITNVGECKQVLDNGKYGMLVTPNNATALAESLEELMYNTSLRTNYATNFNKHILENYSEQNFIHKLVEIYTS